MIRVLLDTNIIIHRETNKIVRKDIGMLFHWLDKLHYEKYVHPITINELKRHKNQDLVDTISIKLQSYHLMKTIAPMHEEVLEISRQMDKTDNDINDTKLLNELYFERVDILITEDKKIHKKAELLGIGDKVYSIEEFLEKVFKENPELVDYKTLAVKKEYFGNINLQSPFFDSFREDYKEFDRWFNRKSDEVAYVGYYQNDISAFLYVKVEDENENYSDISPIFPPKKRLKVGTFKVAINGFKLGERFLKIIFDNARKQKVEEIYLTIFDKGEEQKRLIELIKHWGFYEWGTKTTPNGIEKVYVRPFKKPADKNNPRLTYPFLSKEARVFLVPIYPDYHTELFPDSILQTESPMDFIENKPHRNAIQKVYVSHSLQRNLNKGDIILFYRTAPIGQKAYYASVVTTIGIVEEIVFPKTFDELKNACRKRTVLSDEELNQFWNRKKHIKPFVVKFLYTESLPNPFQINLKKLIELGVLSGTDDAPRGFKEISWESFEKIYREAIKKKK